MDIFSLTVSTIILFLIVITMFYLFFVQPKNQEKLLKIRLNSLINQKEESSKLKEKEEEEIKKSTLELKEKIEELFWKLKTGEELTKNLLENVGKNIKGEIVNQQNLFQTNNKELSERLNKENKELSERLNKDLELRLNNNQQLIKTYLENSSKEILQPLEKLNSVLLHSNKRGTWGNTQLDQLLSSYLPKDNKLYRTEFQLKKKRANNKEEGLRVDAIVFSADSKNNIAIDSKFPLENYLSSIDSNLTEEQKEQFEKKFENDVKKHVDKVSEYVSPEEDGIKYVIMFVPSEVIFSKINEQRYYNIVKVALDKRVSICSPAILLIIIDQLRLWNETWEQYKNLDKITSEIVKFWNNLRLFKDRWEKIIDTIDSNNKNTTKVIKDFNISTRKLIETGEKIKDREIALLKNISEDSSEK